MGIMVYFLIMGNAGFCPSAVVIYTIPDMGSSQGFL